MAATDVSRLMEAADAMMGMSAAEGACLEGIHLPRHHKMMDAV